RNRIKADYWITLKACCQRIYMIQHQTGKRLVTCVKKMYNTNAGIRCREKDVLAGRIFENHLFNGMKNRIGILPSPIPFGLSTKTFLSEYRKSYIFVRAEPINSYI